MIALSKRALHTFCRELFYATCLSLASTHLSSAGKHAKLVCPPVCAEIFVKSPMTNQSSAPATAPASTAVESRPRLSVAEAILSSATSVAAASGGAVGSSQNRVGNRWRSGSGAAVVSSDGNIDAEDSDRLLSSSQGYRSIATPQGQDGRVGHPPRHVSTPHATLALPRVRPCCHA